MTIMSDEDKEANVQQGEENNGTSLENDKENPVETEVVKDQVDRSGDYSAEKGEHENVSGEKKEHQNNLDNDELTQTENDKNQQPVAFVDIKEKDSVLKTPSNYDINNMDSVSITKNAKEDAKMDNSNISHKANNNEGKTPHRLDVPVKPKRMKKGIFISYSPDAGFLERKFVVETVRQLKENNLAEDIWFDKDEKCTDNPVWFSMRMEAVERCRAAIIVASDSYFSCPVSVYEGKALLERQLMDRSSVKVFLVLFNKLEETGLPKQYNHLLDGMVDLTAPSESKKSLAEKTSVVIGSLMNELEQYASINIPPGPASAPYTEFTGEYKKKKICQWGASDLQEWLFKLGIKEFYRQSLAETMVDGFLLMSMTDQDMNNHLGVDSRVVRKKIMQQILLTLDKEHKMADNWHLRARTQRARSNSVYLIYDPADVRLAQNLKVDLQRKGLQVLHHQKLGQSKEEFLHLNGIQMASCTYVLVIMTEAAASSPFVFHEVLFSDWLGKKLVTAMFKNIWLNLRASLKAVLGECLAVDFETKLYAESMDVLEHHIKPLRAVPGVVLEQGYLNKMAEGLKPLAFLANNGLIPLQNDDTEPRVFISYQWDMQSKVEDLRHLLESSGFPCWADISPMMSQGQRGHSSMSSRSSQVETVSETLQSQIQRNMRAASVVVCCVTPKYMQSDNCIKDLTLAETLQKPIIPLLLRFCPWPPEGAPIQVRKILSKLSNIEMYNEKLYKQNVPQVLERIKKFIPGK